MDSSCIRKDSGYCEFPKLGEIWLVYNKGFGRVLLDENWKEAGEIISQGFEEEEEEAKIRFIELLLLMLVLKLLIMSF